MYDKPVERACDECGEWEHVLYSHHTINGGERRVCGKCRDELRVGPRNPKESSELLKRTKDTAYRAALRKVENRQKKAQIRIGRADRKMAAMARNGLKSTHSVDEREDE